MHDLEVHLTVANGKAMIGVGAVSKSGRKACRLRHHESYLFETVDEVRDFLGDQRKSGLSVHDPDSILLSEDEAAD
jgi:hypothetical protein